MPCFYNPGSYTGEGSEQSRTQKLPVVKCPLSEEAKTKNWYLSFACPGNYRTLRILLAVFFNCLIMYSWPARSAHICYFSQTPNPPADLGRFGHLQWFIFTRKRHTRFYSSAHGPGLWQLRPTGCIILNSYFNRTVYTWNRLGSHVEGASMIGTSGLGGTGLTVIMESASMIHLIGGAGLAVIWRVPVQ